ncbi:hypothetical protein BN961_03710 [Afipia felis]|uniref:Uncharacterized protein n=1 Tax=Afipia felis TaxID=1035 RepID=A0A090MV19_AFIFE|nr:hypothetical protein BN961_03710 [Afipia felis]
MPSADQSRCASSISLSDLEIQTALRRPCIQLSSTMLADSRPFPTPVPSPMKKPRRKRTTPFASSAAAATTSKVSSMVQEPARKSEWASPAKIRVSSWESESESMMVAGSVGR